MTTSDAVVLPLVSFAAAVAGSLVTYALVGRRRGRRETEAVRAAAAPAAIGPYTQAVAAGGTVYVSGCIALDAETGEFVEGGVAEQTRKALQNLAAIVGASGSSLGRVVKCTVLLRDMADYAAVNAVYAEFFPPDGPSPPPARAAFAVAGLPRDALVEIDCVCVQ